MAERAGLKVVLFDFDGTLVDLPTDYVAMRSGLHHLFRGYGLNFDFRPIVPSVTRACEAMRTQGHAEPVVAETLQRAEEIITSAELSAAAEASARTGSGELLSDLRARGVRIGVVTNNARATVEVVFRRFGFPTPDVIIARDLSLPPKPSPEPALEALRTLSADRSAALVVGNDDRDVQMARAAGIRAIVVGDAIDGVQSVTSLEEILQIMETGR